jgi:transglutaminase-like putative cysteine protease
VSSRRGALLDRAVLTLVAAGTTWLSFSAWRGFSEDPGSYSGPLLLLALVVAGTGIGLHWARLPDPVVVVVQVLVTGVFAGSLVAGQLVVTAEGWAVLGDRLAAALDASQRYSAPVPADAASIAPLLVLGGWVCLVLVDVCVGSLRRVPLAGLPLLTVYCVPVSMLEGGVPWWSFALTAIGFLLLLFLQQRELTTRWGRGLGTTGGRDVTGNSSVVRASAGSLGAAALVLAVMVPQFVPTLSLSVFGFGPGSGTGGDITVDNPMVDLRRDLLRGDDDPLLQFTTDNPNPGYLRIAALNNFTDNEWSTGDRDIPEDHLAHGELPLPDVDPDIPRQHYQHDVTVLPAFASSWLPTAFPIDRIDAQGDWRYDDATYDFLAADDDLTTAGLEYQMTEVDLDLNGQELADAPSWTGKVSRDFIELPDNFPTFVRSLAQEVTRDHPSRYEKAVALQDWFRKDGGFEYSLDNVPPGNGTDELVAFLTEGTGRVGYCEQFAAAMAAMARSLGIPARVAVGFLAPQQVGAKTFEYSAYDFHAWPELYFAGAGWVRFEPTPADRAPGVPDYTQDRLPAVPDTGETTAPSDAANPSQSLGPNPRLDEGNIPEGQAVAKQDQGPPVARIALIGGGLVLVVLLVLLPRLVRRRRQRSRLRGAVELIWEELRATAIDLGVPWPEHRSPRETRDLLVGFLGDPDAGDDVARPARGVDVSPEAASALDRLVLRLERLRYGRPQRSGHEVDPELVADAESVLAALRAGATRSSRRRADWLPASVLPWRRTPDLAAVPTLVRHGGVVDHVG